MKLPNDVARCAGVGSDEEGWREGCEDCARRTAESTSDVSAWMMPPAIIAFWCEFRIATNAKVSGPEAALSPEGRARLPGCAPAHNGE
jgi:hypothetical protein